MSEKNSPLIRSLEIVNTLWVPATVLYFIEHVGFTRSFAAPFALHRVIDPVLSLIAKVVFLSWLWGLIIETLTGESAVTRLQNFKFNLKRGWWIVAVTIAIPWLVHFLTFMTAEREILSPAFLKNFFYVFTAYWAAGEFIKIKYRHLLSRKFSDILWSWPLLLYGISFLSLSMLLHWIGIKTSSLPLAEPVVGLLAVQVHFLAFTVFSCIFILSYPEISKSFHSPKILILVNPPTGSIRVESFSPVMVRRYPLLFAVLRALTPPEYRVIEYNRIIWREHFYQGNALVAISCLTANCAAVYHIAREFQRRGSKVVLGGPHVTFFPNEALEFCDSVVVGPAEGVWPQIVRDYENNNLQRIYHGHCPEPECAKVHQFLMDSPAKIARECLRVYPGCKFNCHFCCVPALTRGFRTRKPVADMIPLIKKSAQKTKPMIFLDDNIFEDPEYAKELFRAMIPLKSLWAANTSINIAEDDEAVRLLKESRCSQMLIGYEVTADTEMGKKEGKFTFAKNYIPLTRKLQKAGILIQGQFIFGFPWDSWASLARLWWFCWRLSPAFTLVMFLTPLPGSPYFEECIREEKVINLNWRCYDLLHQVAVTPRIKSSWILQNMFSLISLFIFFTTSVAGRFLLAVFVTMEFLYYHAK